MKALKHGFPLPLPLPCSPRRRLLRPAFVAAFASSAMHLAVADEPPLFDQSAPDQTQLKVDVAPKGQPPAIWQASLRRDENGVTVLLHDERKGKAQSFTLGMPYADSLSALAPARSIAGGPAIAVRVHQNIQAPGEWALLVFDERVDRFRMLGRVDLPTEPVTLTSPRIEYGANAQTWMVDRVLNDDGWGSIDCSKPSARGTHLIEPIVQGSVFARNPAGLLSVWIMDQRPGTKQRAIRTVTVAAETGSKVTCDALVAALGAKQSSHAAAQVSTAK